MIEDDINSSKIAAVIYEALLYNINELKYIQNLMRNSSMPLEINALASEITKVENTIELLRYHLSWYDHLLPNLNLSCIDDKFSGETLSREEILNFEYQCLLKD